jgi:hypothetical protein
MDRGDRFCGGQFAGADADRVEDPVGDGRGRRPSLKARRCLGSEGPAASSVSSEGVVDRGRDADSVFAKPGISSRSQLDRILPAGTDTASPR